MVSKRLTNALIVFFWEADSCIADDADDADDADAADADAADADADAADAADDSAITAKGAAQTSAPNNNPKHLFLTIILLIISVIQQ